MLEAIGREYTRLLGGTMSPAKAENVVFAVFTDDLSEGRGDVFVALGLARALDKLGWGVAFWPMHKWNQELPGDTTICISMLESFVPGLMSDNVTRIGWARNWIGRWAGLPYLDEYDAMFASSSFGCEQLREVYEGPVRLLPIAVDPDLFAPSDGVRDWPVSTTVNAWGADRDIFRAVSGATELSNPIRWFGSGVDELDDLSDQILPMGPVHYFDIPGIYRRSRIVLDDLTPSAREHGLHNSRLFESLACGALPIVNARKGLEELDLQEVPFYGGETPLEAQLEALLSEPEETSQLAGRLQEVVRMKHTFTNRAEVVVEELPRARTYQKSRDRNHLLAALSLAQMDKEAQPRAEVVELRKALDDTLQHVRNIEGSSAYRLGRALQRLRRPFV